MANEITVQCALSASKGGASINTVGGTGSATKSYDMTDESMGSGVQSIGFAADELLVIPLDIGSVKYLLLRNLDVTNYVEFSYGTGGGFAAQVRIDPLGFALFRPTAAVFYLKANTAACLVFWAAVEV